MADIIISVKNEKIDYFKERLFVMYEKPEGRSDTEHFLWIIKHLLRDVVDKGHEKLQEMEHGVFDPDLFD